MTTNDKKTAPPAKSVSKPAVKSEAKSPAKTPAKTPVKAAKVEAKSPAKTPVKTPAKTPVKTPAKSPAKSPAKETKVQQKRRLPTAEETSSASEEEMKKKKHRFRPGTVALREVKKQQKSTDTLIRLVPCSKLTRGVAAEFDENVRFQQDALRAIQYGLEHHLTAEVRAGLVMSATSKRMTLSPSDLQGSMVLRGTL